MSTEINKKPFWYGPPEEVERRRIIEALQSTPSQTYDILMKLIRASIMIEHSVTVNDPTASYNSKGKK